MTEEIELKESSKRPLIITILCGVVILAFAITLISIPGVLREGSDQYGSWYGPYLLVSQLLILISMVGYWLMRRWGVYLFTALFIVSVIIGLVFSMPFTITGVIIPVIVIVIGIVYFKQMK